LQEVLFEAFTSFTKISLVLWGVSIYVLRKIGLSYQIKSASNVLEALTGMMLISI